MRFWFYMIFAFILLFTNSCKTLKTVMETPYDYGCKGDGKSNDLVNMQRFFNEKEVIHITSGTFLINGDLHVTGKKKIIIDGKLKGVKGNEIIFFDGDIELEGKGTFERFSLEIQGGSFSAKDIKLSNAGKTAAILLNNKKKKIRLFHVQNIEIYKGGYGILRQGAFGQQPTGKAIVENCYIHDCRGDGIEWNVGEKDGEVDILNNKIENINSDKGGNVGKFWGMGIGVAGGSYSDLFDKTMSNFRIIGNTITNVRHGIHVESGSNFIISKNDVTISSKVSTKGKLALVGIVIYGSKDYKIENNKIDAGKGLALWNSFGSLKKIGYLAPPTNYTVSNNIVKGRVVNWCSGDNNKVEVFGNLINGSLEHYGAAYHEIYNNKIYGDTDKSALKIDFYYSVNDRRKSYNAKGETTLIEKDNLSLDKYKKSNKEIINIDGMHNHNEK